MERKKIGYYISKGKCLKVFAQKKLNRRTNRMVVKKVNYKGKTIRKGTKVYKKKTECMKKLKKMMAKKSKSKVKSKVKSTKRRQRFGTSCTYNVPYFGSVVPQVGRTFNGVNMPSSGAWMWPQPGELALDKQQGFWTKVKKH